MKICLKNVSIISVNNAVEVKRAGDVVFENNKIFYEKNNLENCDKVVSDENLVILPKFNYFNVESRTNKINNMQYDFFNLENVTLKSLENQLENFKKNDILPFMFLKDILLPESVYDIIVPFCHKNKIKIMVCVGETLTELGTFDKLYNMSPIDFLESYGVLDCEPIIFSAANLEKDDLEKLSYYGATICLNLTHDLLCGNGIASILTMQKLGLNIVFNTNVDDVFKEMFLCYTLPKGLLNSKTAISLRDVFCMATTNFNKIVKNNNANEINLSNCIVLKTDNKFDDELKNVVLTGNNNQIVNIF